MRITTDQRDELFAHALEAVPNECCGYVRLVNGAVEEIVRAENVQDSPMYGYWLDSRSLFAMYAAMDNGDQIAVYHSHPRSSAAMSQTDINLAMDSNIIYLIVSPAGDDPHMAAWRVKDGKVSEETIEFS